MRSHVLKRLFEIFEVRSSPDQPVRWQVGEDGSHAWNTGEKMLN
jgi:hypothetical protein